MKQAKEIISSLTLRDFQNLDIKKLKGRNDNIFRARKGKIRIIFKFKKNKLQILEAKRRNEGTYRNI